MSARHVLSLAVAASLALFAQAARAAADENDPLFIKGRSIFSRCLACHAFKPDTRSLSRGPNLWGVIGRKAGTAPGYTEYSQAMLKSNVVWSFETIDKYLADPKAFIPGNLMSFIGVPKPDERKALVTYLVTISNRQPAVTQTTGLKLYRADD